jgi:hypothetical protein
MRKNIEFDYQIFFSKPIKRLANKFSRFLAGVFVLEDSSIEDAIVVVTKRFVKYV